MKFDEWQKEVIECNHKRILICKGRQIGGTTVFAKKAADRLANNKGYEIMVTSITEEQAQHVILMVLHFLEEEHKNLISKKKQDTTKGKILLKNKSQIISKAVGTTGASVRGFTKGTLWLNEASRLPEFVFEAAKPMLLTTAGDIWMDSTPAGKKGYFYRCFENKNNIWKVFYKSTVEVINERRISDDWTEEKREGALKLLEDERKEMTELQFGQEYLGLFLEELRQFFPDQLIDRICTINPKDKIFRHGKNVMGNDLARRGGDYFTAEVLKKATDGKTYQIDHFHKKDLDTTENESLIREFTIKHECKKVGIDAGSGSLGVSILDHLRKDPYMKRRLIPMNNRSISIDKDERQQRLFKEDLYDNLKSMMEHNEIFLFDDEDIKASLRSVQIELIEDAHGLPRFRIFGNFTHIAEGLVRAAWLAREQKNIKHVLSSFSL